MHICSAQDAASPLVAPMTNLAAGTHDSTGGWMSGGAAGRLCFTIEQVKFLLTKPVAPMTSLAAVAHDSTGGWGTGSAAGGR